MEVLVLFAALGVAGLMSDRRWRRRLIYPLLGVVGFFSIAISSPFIALATWGLSFAVPPDSGNSTEAIVILGRGEALRSRRIELAEQLWRAKRAPEIFVSGRYDAHPAMVELKQNGIPVEQVWGEDCSESTEENAIFTAIHLFPNEIRSILLITDPPHLWRSFLLFQSYGFIVTPYPSPLPSKLTPINQIQLITREYLALVQHYVSGQFKPRTNEEINQRVAKADQKSTALKCKIQKI